jgi:hypothetical protein
MPHLLTLTGNRLVDSAVVSNLGRPDAMPSFGLEAPTVVQFTPPYLSAASFYVGAISSGGYLHLGLRHRLKALDGPAGRRFADLLVEILREGGPPGYPAGLRRVPAAAGRAGGSPGSW